MGKNELLIEKKGHIATLTLNRPEQMNTFNSEMATELNRGLRDLDVGGSLAARRGQPDGGLVVDDERRARRVAGGKVENALRRPELETRLPSSRGDATTTMPEGAEPTPPHPR